MSAERMDPESRGRDFFADEFGEVGVAVFAEGEELGLQDKVGHGVGDDQGKEDH